MCLRVAQALPYTHGQVFCRVHAVFYQCAQSTLLFLHMRSLTLGLQFTSILTTTLTTRAFFPDSTLCPTPFLISRQRSTIVLRSAP